MPATLHKPSQKSNTRRSTIRSAAVQVNSPSSLDRESRTVRATIASDTPVRMYDWALDEAFDEVLIPAGMVEPKRMRLRVDHRSYDSLNVIGRVADFEITRHTVEATLRFSNASDVEPVFTRVAEGDLDSVSIGADYSMDNTKRLEPNQSALINGTRYTASDVPMRLVRIWSPYETSIVDEGADSRSVIRSRKIGTGKESRVKSGQLASRERNHHQGSETMPKTAERIKRTRPTEQPARSERSQRATESTQPAKTKRAATGERTPAQIARRAVRQELAKQVEERIAPSDVDVTAPKFDPKEIVSTERKRVAAITKLANGDQSLPKKLIQRAIDEGWSVGKTSNAILKHMQEQSGDPVTQSGNGVERAPAGHIGGGVTIESLQAAVLMRSGMNIENKIFATEAAQIALERNGMGWIYEFNRDLITSKKSELEKHIEIGRKYRTDHPARTCERMLGIKDKYVPSDQDMMIERSFNNSYMPKVFGVLVVTGIIKSYGEFQDSTMGWVASVDWKDFRINNPVGIDQGQTLTKHTSGTTAKDITFSEYGEQYAIDRYTGKFMMDEMAIINDQIGFGQTVPAEMGEMSAKLRPTLVYGLLYSNPNLSDGVALFHTSRGNLVTGCPVSIPGLTLAESTMALQKITTPDGKTQPLDLIASHVIVPRSQKANAKVVTKSTTIVSGNVTTQGDMNPHSGDYMVHSDARMDIGVWDPRQEAQVAGSQDLWFLAAENGKETLEFGYRTGTGRAPQIRTNRLSNGAWGICWDVAHDVGIGIRTGRTMVRCRIS